LILGTEIDVRHAHATAVPRRALRMAEGRIKIAFERRALG
jgi:hypothetical protein